MRAQVIYVDCRCLQDESFQYRGIGIHVASLLRSRIKTEARHGSVIGFTDRDMPELPAELRQLLDVVSPCFQPTCSPRGSIFVDSSPMTHDPILALRVADHAATLRACIVYDFIPFDWPGYLPDIASRIDYVSRLRRLRDADLFLPISEYSARRLSEILGIPDDSICVTGACVRRSLYLRYPG